MANTKPLGPRAKTRFENTIGPQLVQAGELTQDEFQALIILGRALGTEAFQRALNDVRQARKQANQPRISITGLASAQVVIQRGGSGFRVPITSLGDVMQWVEKIITDAALAKLPELEAGPPEQQEETPPPAGLPELDEYDRPIALALRAGTPRQEIAQTLDVGRGSIQRVARQLREYDAQQPIEDVPPPTDTPPAPLDPTDTAAVDRRIIELVQAGSTYDAIQSELGVSHARIANTKRTYGLLPTTPLEQAARG